MEIRRAKLVDAKAIHEIEVETFATPWSYNSIIMEITENELSEYRVLIEDDKLIGFGGMWIIFDEAHITNFAIDKDYRGKGYSKLLMEDIIEFCVNKKLIAITLEVRVSNTVAINLYESYGFKEYGVRKNYYEGREDALIMWKELII